MKITLAIIQCLLSSVIAYVAYRLFRRWEVFVLTWYFSIALLDIFAALKQIQRYV